MGDMMLSSLARTVGRIFWPLWLGWGICWLVGIPVAMYAVFAALFVAGYVRLAYRRPLPVCEPGRRVVGGDGAGRWVMTGDRLTHECAHDGAAEVWTIEVPGIAPSEKVAHWCDRCKTQLPWDWAPDKRKVTFDGGAGYQNVEQLARAIRRSGVSVEQLREHWLAQARGEPRMSEVEWAVDLAGNRHPLGSTLWPAPTEAERRAGKEVAGIAGFLILPDDDGVIRAPRDRDVEGMYRSVDSLYVHGQPMPDSLAGTVAREQAKLIVLRAQSEARTLTEAEDAEVDRLIGVVKAAKQRETREQIEAAGYDAVCVPDIGDPPGCEHHTHVRGERRAS